MWGSGSVAGLAGEAAVRTYPRVQLLRAPACPRETRPRREKGKKGGFSVKLISVSDLCGVCAVLLTDAMQRMMARMEKSAEGLSE